RDWHPRRHPSFLEEGGRWPPHCLQDTPGAAFHPDLELPEDAVLITKGVRFDGDQYSAFNETGLAERLKRDGNPLVESIEREGVTIHARP
ncbi:MAG: isochorismatase family protein, partial [Acidobacteriota bacterium]